MVHPIMDQYYTRNPQHRRSAAFVCTKGFSANEKATSRSGTPFCPPASIPPVTSLPHFPGNPESHKQRLRGPTIPAGLLSTRTADGPFATSGFPRSRTPPSHAETNTQEPSSLQPPTTDVRELTAPPIVRAASQQPPVQGNIKKKRATLGPVEGLYGGGGAGGTALAQYFDTSPVTPEPVRTEFGNPEKIARMFPELALQ